MYLLYNLEKEQALGKFEKKSAAFLFIPYTPNSVFSLFLS